MPRQLRIEAVPRESSPSCQTERGVFFCPSCIDVRFAAGTGYTSLSPLLENPACIPTTFLLHIGYTLSEIIGCRVAIKGWRFGDLPQPFRLQCR